MRSISRALLACLWFTGFLSAEPRITFDGSVAPLPPAEASTRRDMPAKNAGDFIEFSVALKMRNYPQMQARIARGEIIPRQELEQNHLPLQKDYDAVVNWLVSQGFTITLTDPSRLAVYARGTHEQVMQSLQVHFSAVTSKGKDYPAADTAPSLPQSIAAPVLGINHLQPFRKLAKHAMPKPTPQSLGTPGQPPFLVSEILKAYNGQSMGVSGANQKIAILIDTFPNTSDLTAFWSANSISQSLSNVEMINVNSASLASPSGEETLDAEWTSGVAPNAKIRIYAAGSLAFSALDKCLQQMISDLPTQTQMHQLSISLGLGETYLTTSQFNTDSQYFATLASGGVSIFVSTGDYGSTPNSSNGNNGPLQVEYFSSDPSVTGVGGTSLTVSGSTGLRTSETAWSGSGGGVSSHFSRPSWQTGTGVPAGSYRCVPDVALTADPNTGAYVYLNGGVYQYGGTSWSTPMWAGLCAMVNEARANLGKAPLGLINPSIYPLVGSSNFTDITSGSNSTPYSSGLYATNTGYDNVTGLGVPNMSALVTTLSAQAPGVLSFSPGSGVINTQVVISGYYFSSASAVSFNGTSATFTLNSSSQITANVPSGATTGPISVTTPNGTGTSSSNFTVTPGSPVPSLSGFSPTYGLPGASVTISGLYLTGATAVSFNGTAASFTVNSDTQITATVPSGAASGILSVTTPGGTVSSASSFTFLTGSGAPTITSFTPIFGRVGSTVVITGTNYVAVTGVFFNGTTATFTVNSPTQITATVPAGVTTGTISVTTSNGTGASANSFTVYPSSVGPVVISQVYGGGGASGASYTNDFVEIYNRSALAIDLTGYSLQYAAYNSLNGTSWTTIPLSSTTIQPGKYYLIKLGSSGSSGTSLPAADLTYNLNISTNHGKVALVNNTTALTVSNPASLTSVVDLVGYGSGTNGYEGSGPTSSLAANTAAMRQGYGSTDVGNNSTDFTTGTPNPRNSSSAAALPDLTSLVSHGGNFTRSDTADTYTITVTNSGTTPTNAPVSLTDTLPTGLTATAISGTGWTCNLSNLTCTRSDSVAAGASYPSITLTVSVASNAGSPLVNSAMVSGGGESNVSNDSASDSTIVNLPTATVTLGSLTQTYDGSSKSVSVTTVPSGLSFSVTYNGSSTVPTNAGNYAVVATVTDANYQGNASGTLVVSKAAATVTLGSLAQTYTGSARVATATTSSSGLTVTFTYNGSGTAPTAAGSYTVVGTISDTNYQGSSSGTLVVSKATATVTLASLAQTYAGSARVATATTTPSGLAVNFTYNGSGTAPTAVGSYTVVGTISDTNYQGNSSGTLVISKATATVTLGSLAQTYTGSTCFATASTNPSGLTVNFTYNGSGTAPSNAGSYAVVGTINDTNYQGSSTGTLVVSKATATVMLGSLTQTYDGGTKSATATTSPSGLTVNFTYNGSGTVPTNAGSYGVVGTISDTNYQGSASDTLLVTKATATVTLGSLTQTYDGGAKSATATTSPSGLTVNFTYNGSGSVPTNAGSYAVVGTISDTNYQGSASDTLLVSKATATVTLESLAQTYDSGAKFATATTNPGSLTVNFTYNGSGSEPVAAGNYTVVGTISDTNYQGSATGTLVVAKGAAVITLGALAQTYDGGVKSATATTNPGSLTVTFTYDGSSDVPVNSGSYAVAATIVDTNYQGSASGTLVVSKAAATVTLGSLVWYYDGSAKSATATTTPVGLTVDLTYGGSPVAPSALGTYAVVGTVNDMNYQGASSATLQIYGETISAWRARLFTTNEIASGAADDNADPAGDGMTNLAKYALGIDPHAWTAQPSSVRGSDGLSVTFTRPKNLPDVVYAAESSDDMVHWSPVALQLMTDGPTQTMRAIDPLTSGNTAQRFIRLVFTR